MKRIALVTIGTQGDVQPYLALAIATRLLMHLPDASAWRLLPALYMLGRDGIYKAGLRTY